MLALERGEGSPAPSVPGDGAEQVLQVVVGPANAGAQEQRIAIALQKIVQSPDDVGLAVELPAPGQAHPRVEIVFPAEVERVERKQQPIVEKVEVQTGPGRRFDEPGSKPCLSQAESDLCR